MVVLYEDVSHSTPGVQYIWIVTQIAEILTETKFVLLEKLKARRVDDRHRHQDNEHGFIVEVALYINSVDIQYENTHIKQMSPKTTIL